MTSVCHFDIMSLLCCDFLCNNTSFTEVEFKLYKTYCIVREIIMARVINTKMERNILPTWKWGGAGGCRREREVGESKGRGRTRVPKTVGLPPKEEKKKQGSSGQAQLHLEKSGSFKRPWASLLENSPLHSGCQKLHKNNVVTCIFRPLPFSPCKRQGKLIRRVIWIFRLCCVNHHPPYQYRYGIAHLYLSGSQLDKSIT